MPLTLTLYYRNGCHLCEALAAEIQRLHGSQVQIQWIDIDTDKALQERYALKVPVLADGNNIISQGSIDHTALENYLSLSQK